MTWTQTNPTRFTREDAGHNSDEDLTLVVYKMINHRWKWQALDANDFSLIDAGTAATALAAQRAADAFANR